jgi:hypothetical protein
VSSPRVASPFSQAAFSCHPPTSFVTGRDWRAVLARRLASVARSPPSSRSRPRIRPCRIAAFSNVEPLCCWPHDRAQAPADAVDVRRLAARLGFRTDVLIQPHPLDRADAASGAATPNERCPGIAARAPRGGRCRRQPPFQMPPPARSLTSLEDAGRKASPNRGHFDPGVVRATLRNKGALCHGLILRSCQFDAELWRRRHSGVSIGSFAGLRVYTPPPAFDWFPQKGSRRGTPTGGIA